MKSIISTPSISSARHLRPVNMIRARDFCCTTVHNIHMLSYRSVLFQEGDSFFGFFFFFIYKNSEKYSHAAILYFPVEFKSMHACSNKFLPVRFSVCNNRRSNIDSVSLSYRNNRPFEKLYSVRGNLIASRVHFSIGETK